jgi:calcium-dependent protein kinase
MMSVVGTPYYMAPEVLTRKYGPECDIWAVGVIMYFMLSGEMPFTSDNRKDLFRKIRKEPINLALPEWEGLSSSSKDLVEKLLIKDPKKRITITEALQHQWFKLVKTEEQPMAD